MAYDSKREKNWFSSEELITCYIKMTLGSGMEMSGYR